MEFYYFMYLNGMKTYFVYILKCSDNSYYVGVTNNLERRVGEHENSLNESSYTFKRRPITLVWYDIYSDIRQAITKEKQLKGWSRNKKEALIENDWNKIVELSNKKNIMNGYYLTNKK